MRKSIIFAVIVSVFAFSGFSQERDEEGYTKQEIQDNVTKYKNMRRNGIVLTCVGIASVGAGIALVSNAKWETTSTSTGTEASTQDPAGGFGLVCLVVGVPVSILGLVFTGIGAGKYNEYNKRLQLFGGYVPSKKGYVTKLVYSL